MHPLSRGRAQSSVDTVKRSSKYFASEMLFCILCSFPLSIHLLESVFLNDLYKLYLWHEKNINSVISSTTPCSSFFIKCILIKQSAPDDTSSKTLLQFSWTKADWLRYHPVMTDVIETSPLQSLSGKANS